MVQRVEGRCGAASRGRDSKLVSKLAASSKILLSKINPLNIIFDDFSYSTIRIQDRVQVSISSTRAYFHKYCVPIKHRSICNFLIFI